MSGKIQRSSSLEEVAAAVCETLNRAGIEAVLTGGAVVSIYAEDSPESFDLDFIVRGLGKTVDEAMGELGFSREKGRHFQHPDSPYFVEFPGSVVAIGEEIITQFSQRRSKLGTLRLLSATDCVKDRLAAYFHWGDRQGLEQALSVALAQNVSIAEIERWAKQERESEKFEEFKKRLKAHKRGSKLGAS